MGRKKGKNAVRKDIVRLFDMAQRHSKEPELARSYVEKARKLAMRHRIPLREYNKMHCRKCCTYWVVDTLRVRIRHECVAYTCLHCGFTRRFKK